MLEGDVLEQKTSPTREGSLTSGAKTKSGSPLILLAKAANKRYPWRNN